MATRLSILTSLKAELVAQTWTGTSNVVFPTGSVLVTKSPEVKQALATLRPPMALIMPGSAQCDPEYHEEPDLLVFDFRVRLLTVVPGDHVGENPLMGANKKGTGSTTASEGRGIFEIEQELYNAVGRLNVLESIVIQNRQVGDVGATVYDSGSGILYVAYCDYQFETICTLV